MGTPGPSPASRVASSPPGNPHRREGGSRGLRPQARPRPLPQGKAGDLPSEVTLGRPRILSVLQWPPYMRSRAASDDDPRTQRCVNALVNCVKTGQGEGRLRTERPLGVEVG